LELLELRKGLGVELDVARSEILLQVSKRGGTGDHTMSWPPTLTIEPTWPDTYRELAAELDFPTFSYSYLVI
jgi:hypothetical protein